MSFDDFPGNSKFSYSVTGGAKKNAIINDMIQRQNDKNLSVWKFLVNNPTTEEGGIISSYEVYYNKEQDAVMIADQYVYSQDDKNIHDQRDHLWITIIHRPTFYLAPSCKVEKRCFSLEIRDFGEVIEERPTREIYDLKFFLSSEYNIRV